MYVYIYIDMYLNICIYKCISLYVNIHIRMYDLNISIYLSIRRSLPTAGGARQRRGDKRGKRQEEGLPWCFGLGEGP